MEERWLERWGGFLEQASSGKSSMQIGLLSQAVFEHVLQCCANTAD